MPISTIINKKDEFLLRLICDCGTRFETTERPPEGMTAFNCPNCGVEWEICPDCLTQEGTLSTHRH